MNKKKTLTAALIGICFLVASAASYAAFTVEGTTTNTISSTSLSITTSLQDGSGASVNGLRLIVVPGAIKETEFNITNTGREPAWVRVRVAVVAGDTHIELADDGSAENKLKVALRGIDKNYWTYQGGFFYYNKQVEAGQTIGPLMTHIEFPSSMGNEYANAEASLDVDAQATQVRHNANSALEAEGWPE